MGDTFYRSNAFADETLGSNAQVTDPFIVPDGNYVRLFYASGPDQSSYFHVKMAVFNGTLAQLVNTSEDALNTTLWNPTLYSYNSGAGTVTVANGNLTITRTSGAGISLRSANALGTYTDNLLFYISSRVGASINAQTRITLHDSTTTEALWGYYLNNGNAFYLNGAGVGDPSYAETYTTATGAMYEMNGKVATPVLKKNTTTVATGTGTPSNPAGSYFRIWQYDNTGTDSINLSWVSARPYVSPEPAHGDWQAEQNSTTTAPVASFTQNKTVDIIPGWLQLNDTSTNTPISWAVSWGDSTANSTLQNATHQYLIRGKWTIIMTSSNSAGSGSASSSVLVYGSS
jgi:PKD repeat protein